MERHNEITISTLDLISFLLLTPQLIGFLRPVIGRVLGIAVLFYCGCLFLVVVLVGEVFALRAFSAAENSVLGWTLLGINVMLAGFLTFGVSRQRWIKSIFVGSSEALFAIGVALFCSLVC